jgi:hypothetical protein
VVAAAWFPAPLAQNPEGGGGGGGGGRVAGAGGTVAGEEFAEGAVIQGDEAGGFTPVAEVGEVDVAGDVLAAEAAEDIESLVALVAVIGAQGAARRRW